jgi:hypothetical protein
LPEARFLERTLLLVVKGMIEDSEELASDVALQAATDLAIRLAFSAALVEVFPSSRVV